MIVGLKINSSKRYKILLIILNRIVSVIRSKRKKREVSNRIFRMNQW